MVLGLKGEVFHYWFVSDVGTELHWAKGNFTRGSEEMRLSMKAGESIEDPQFPLPDAVLGRRFVEADWLYDDTWRYVSEDNDVFMASTEDLNEGRDKERWLRRVVPQSFDKYFAENGPFFLHINPQFEGEQVDAIQPATAVDSKAESNEKPKPASEGRSQ